MLTPWFIFIVSIGYLCLLFAIAYYGDSRADKGESIVRNPYIYSLSLAVYCTSWTYYGSVGRAASGGVGFLPIYLGPTLMFTLGWFILRKIIRISKTYNITSIADFISTRYGKSHLLGGLVTIIALVGIMPYVSLQLKAVSTSYDILVRYGGQDLLSAPSNGSFLTDTALYVALLLAAFTILFGTRHIDATEQHQGMVAAIAFESIVKLLAFLAVGVFVTYSVFDGPGEIFHQASARPELEALFTMDHMGDGEWLGMTLLAMVAIVCLPRQFQVGVVENMDERHLAKATWLFPLYLLAINLFVLPIAMGGLILFGGINIDADTFVLAIPISEGNAWLALFVFIGGLSAATGMVIVTTIAISTMVSNDLVMPLLLRVGRLHLSESKNLSGLLLGIRRAAIILIVLLGYTYFRLVGEAYALVTIGLVAFAAAAQFGPAIFGGIFWRGATRTGALTGLIAGFGVWVYTLVLPSFALSGWIDQSLISEGPFGINILKPYELFGLRGLDHITHSLFWSMFANIGCYLLFSLYSRPTALERNQATLFVEVFRQRDKHDRDVFWRGHAAVEDLVSLAERFIGTKRAHRGFDQYARRRGLDLKTLPSADADLVKFTERLLAGAMGGASARILVASVVKGEGVPVEEMMEIVDEATQVIEYSHELEKAHAELKEANEQLKELDRMKDEFLSTITHELRTPLTSIRAFAEILQSDPSIAAEKRQEFLDILVKETNRLTRLVNQVLDLAKLESQRFDWTIETFDLPELVLDGTRRVEQLLEQNNIALSLNLSPGLPPVQGDKDKILQVVINLISNAQKVMEETGGQLSVTVSKTEEGALVTVADNGPGIAEEDQRLIFDRFYQANQKERGNPMGVGLGLAISQKIVEHLNGRIWVESELGLGSAFCFTLPLKEAE